MLLFAPTAVTTDGFIYLYIPLLYILHCAVYHEYFNVLQVDTSIRQNRLYFK